MAMIIVPPVFKIAGRNFSAGRTMNLSLPRNFRHNASATPIGPRNFFSLCQVVGSGWPNPGGGSGVVADSSRSIRGKHSRKTAAGQLLGVVSKKRENSRGDTARQSHNQKTTESWQ